MSNRFKLICIVIVLSIASLMWVILNDIRQTYLELGAIQHELSALSQQFQQYQKLVQKVNDIDSKFTQELTDAKAENLHRYNNVINHVARLQLNSSKTATATLDDANACELTGEARQNYYLLRNDIITKDNVILGLQHYIREVCLAK